MEASAGHHQARHAGLGGDRRRAAAGGGEQRRGEATPVRHPGPKQQYVSAAQAAARGELALGQPGMFGDTYGTNPASPGAGGSDVEGGLASSVGLTNPSSQWSGGPHAGPGGLPGSSLNDAFGAGTLLGALAGMSEAGRAVAGMSHAHHGGPGGGMSDPFGVGQILYGRGMGTQLVSAGKKGSAFHRLMSWVTGPHPEGDAIFNGMAKGALGGVVASLVSDVPLGEAGMLVGGLLGWRDYEKSKSHSAPKPKSGTKEFDPWYGIMYGQRGDGGATGNYPRVTPGQSGRPTVSLYMMQHFAEQLKRMGEQAHGPDGSDSGGGGRSAAPQRLFFHGAKHWYDVVAEQR